MISDLIMSTKPILLRNLTVSQLKKLLHNRGKSVGGNKGPLKAKLRALLENDVEVENVDTFDFRAELEQTPASQQTSAAERPKTVDRKRIGKHTISLTLYYITKWEIFS